MKCILNCILRTSINKIRVIFLRTRANYHAIVTDLVAGAFVRAHALNEGDGERVELVGVVGLVDDGQRHSQSQPLEVTHLRHNCHINTPTLMRCTCIPSQVLTSVYLFLYSHSSLDHCTLPIIYIVKKKKTAIYLHTIYVKVFLLPK